MCIHNLNQKYFYPWVLHVYKYGLSRMHSYSEAIYLSVLHIYFEIHVLCLAYFV